MMKTLPKSLSPERKSRLPLGRARDEGAEEDRLAFPDVLQVSPDREDGDHDRHHHQSEVQRPARPAEELINVLREHFQDCIHDPILLWARFAPFSFSTHRSAENIARDSVPPERFRALKPFCSRIRVA